MKLALVSLVLLPAVMAQTAPPADPLDALVADSPFLPPAGGMRGAAATSVGPLELRSIVFVDGAYQFSIFDQGANKAEWVRIDERGHPFVARSFNREKDSLTVDHQGRTLVLALQTAKMGSGAPAAPQPPMPLPAAGDRRNPPQAAPSGNAANNAPGPAPQPPAAPAAQTAPPPPGSTNAAEAQRLQNLADEIRRRRGTGPQTVLPPKN